MTSYDKKKKAIIEMLDNIKSQVKNDQLDEEELRAKTLGENVK